ncbi:MAG: hypothetical protein KAI70_01480, partial [Candidatus Omnitrophica bacterium]|nr:hypothetical protein [Candidatus Omnitrophota bacterium]
MKMQDCRQKDDPLRPSTFIDVRTNRRKRIVLKTISMMVAFIFFFQQIAYSWDFAYQPAVSSVGDKVDTIPGYTDDARSLLYAELEEHIDELEVTNYDMFSNKKQSGLRKFLPTGKEQEQRLAYEPTYLKRQQNKHEEIMRQKQETSDLMFLLNANRRHRKEYEEDMPLKKKQSTGGSGGGIYYTLEDYRNESPLQINVYVYENGKARKRMLELVSYDISGLVSAGWVSKAEEIEPKEGDPFIGSYKKLEGAETLTDNRIIRKTVYSGKKEEEKIEYVLSRYDDEGIPGEVTVYDYHKLGGDNLDETITYNISDLDINFESGNWEEELTEDRITRRTVYEGVVEEEKISLVFESYVIADNGDNTPNRISVYDYQVDEGKDLDEVRAYSISGLQEEEWETEDEARLESISVYTGEEDKEKTQYTLSYFSQEGDEYIPWERKDYDYSGDILSETKIYDISDMDSEERITIGAGEIVETAEFSGDKSHERIDRSYDLYDGAGTPQLRTDYSYDGRTLSTVNTYDIVGLPLDSIDILQEANIYEGRAGEERILDTMSYYRDGSFFKDTHNNYEQNSRGMYFILNATERTYSSEGDIVERVETENNLIYTRFGQDVEDINGNLRNSNIKTYYTFLGEERLDKEDDVVYSKYTAKKQPGEEWRTFYVYNRELDRLVEVGYQETVNELYSLRGSAIRQVVDSYTVNGVGERIYDTTKVVENHRFDYYSNIIDRSETVWKDKDQTQFYYHKTIHNDYDDILAQRRGNAANTETIRYDSITKEDTSVIDKIQMEVLEFNERGYAVSQTTDTSVMDKLTDPLNPILKLVTRRETLNEDIDVRGDAAVQYVSTYQTDYSGTEASLELLNYEISTNREFDSHHNVLNQSIYTYSEQDEATRFLLDIREIRSVGFHMSGTALKQITATYADENKTELLEVQVVENFEIDSEGHILSSFSETFGSAEIGDSGEGEINYSEPIGRQTTANFEFDIRGNILSQATTYYYYDEEAGEFVFSETRYTVNDPFDFLGRTTHSETISYADEEGTVISNKKDVFYDDYDRYGNATEQRINTYIVDEVTQQYVLLDHKTITSQYDNLIAQTRGNATEVTTVRYKDLGETILLDQTVMKTNSFDTRGNALEQTSETSKYDHVTAGLVLTNRNYITNADHTNNGDARYQETKSMEISYDEFDNEIETITSFQVMVNRKYDSQHNLLNQMVMTYSDDPVSGGELMEVQEIRSMGYTSSGVARQQIILTYEDEQKTVLIDAQFIKNVIIGPTGAVEESVITRYSTLADTDTTGSIVLSDLSGELDRQTILTKEFDDYDNALEQKIVREYYDEIQGAFVFSEAQVMKNYGYDLHGRVERNVILTYDDVSCGVDNFVQVQDIVYVEYDEHGNSLEQTIDTYVWDESKAKVDLDGIIATNDEDTIAVALVLCELMDHKRITNVYTDSKARFKGNATISTTDRYKDTEETVQLDRTVITTSLFDTRGNALSQISETLRYDDVSDGLKLTNRNYITNADYSNNGDAGYQDIKSTEISYDEFDNEIETITSFQVMTNRKYDSQHNLLNQMVMTYSDDPVSGGDLMEVKEIRSTGYTTSGVARQQIILTYEDEAKTVLIDAQFIENTIVSPTGNVEESVITRYGLLSDTFIDTAGAISISDLAGELDRQTIIIEEFDDYGNALEQKIVREYYDETQGAFVFSEAQMIKNYGYDIYNYLERSVILTYNDAVCGVNNFIQAQDIVYEEYDEYGNVLNQTIDAYVWDDSKAKVDLDGMILVDDDATIAVALALCELMDHKRIANEYTDTRAQFRGNATVTTTDR